MQKIAEEMPEPKKDNFMEIVEREPQITNVEVHHTSEPQYEASNYNITETKVVSSIVSTEKVVLEERTVHVDHK